MAAAKPTIVVMTATSNTGLAVVETLLRNYSDKVNVRAVVRSPKGAAAVRQALEAQGLPVCEIVTGDIKKSQMHAPVFRGALAAYLATPNTEDRAALGQQFIDACLANGVKYGVVISMLCADQQATAFQRQFAAIEQYALSKAGKPVTLAAGDKGKELFQPVIVRSAPFFQNLFGFVTGMAAGKLYYPLAEGHFPHVDLNDVARVLAAILVNPAPHAGRTYNCLAEYQGGNQLASAIGLRANRGCTYESVDDATAVAAFEVLGLTHSNAVGHVETLRFFRTGRGQDVPAGDIEALTGNKPAKFGDFVRDTLKPLIVAAAAAK